MALVPFLWMISTSFMSLGEAQGLTLIPSELRWENFAIAWEEGNFTEYYVNSILITVITLAGEMTFMQKLAHEGKIAQGLFVARKKK